MKSFPDALDVNASGMRVAIVAARFNDDVVGPLLDCAVETLRNAGASDRDVVVHRVPGAFELPLAARLLARTGNFDGIVALGAVIRGETPHFDFVCNEAARGINDVSLEFELPVGFGVITALSDEQAMARAGGAVGNKGEEATRAVIEMIALARTLKKMSGSPSDKKALDAKRAHVRARSRARRLAMQGLYQWQLTEQPVQDIMAQQKLGNEYPTVDPEHYRLLIRTATKERERLDELLSPALNIPEDQLDPIERAVMWCAIIEFEQCMDVPYRVVINEAVEVAKRFGGTDGHRFVNGVLDRLATQLRPGGR